MKKLFYGLGITTALIHMSFIILYFMVSPEIPLIVLFISLISLFINISLMVDVWMRKSSYKQNWIRTEIFSYRYVFMFLLFSILAFLYSGENMIYFYLYLVASLLWITATIAIILSWDIGLKYHRHSFIFKPKNRNKRNFKKIKKYLKINYNIDLESKGNTMRFLSVLSCFSKPDTSEKVIISNQNIQVHAIQRGIIVSGREDKHVKKIIEEINKIILKTE